MQKSFVTLQNNLSELQKAAKFVFKYMDIYINKGSCVQAMWGWLVVTVPAVVEWRFFIEVSGEQCVMMVGIWLMLQWCVESWAVENHYVPLVLLTLGKDQDQYGWMKWTVLDQCQHWRTVNQKDGVKITVIMVKMLESAA